jgi:hypothetical protein
MFGGGFGGSQDYASMYGGSPAAGGGFFSPSQGTGSPAVGRTYPSRALLPVTIAQVLKAQQPETGDAKFQIDGKDFSQVKIVGQVMNVNLQATNASYLIDDGTGSISVKKWNSGDESAEKNESSGLDHHYVRIFGKVVEFQGKRSINCHSISPITDFNEITAHLLEAAYIHLVNTRGSLAMPVSVPFGSNAIVKSEGPGASIQIAPDSQAVARGIKLTPVQDLVFNVFARHGSSDTGLSINAVCGVLPQLSRSQIQ